MPENEEENEQGYRGRKGLDRQQMIDEATHDIAGQLERDEGFTREPIFVEIPVGEGAKRGPVREVAPQPGESQRFTSRPLPKDPQKGPGLETRAPAREGQPAKRDFGPILDDGRRLFDQYFENFKKDILSRVDPHQGITADNYDFEALYQQPQFRDEFRVSNHFGKLLLPEKFRIGPTGLDPAQLKEAVAREKADRVERGEIGALSPAERQNLFNHLESFLDAPVKEPVRQKDIDAFKKAQGRQKFTAGEVRAQRKSFAEGTIEAGAQKLASRFPKAIRAGGDAIRKVEIGKFPDGKSFTAGDLFKVFGVDEVVKIPKISEPKIDDSAVDITSEFIAIALAFLLLKGTGAPGVVAPLTVAEAGTLDIETNFANLLQELDPEAQSLILETLAANPSDTDFEKLAKALVVDVGLPTALVAGVIKSLQVFKKLGGLRALEGEEGSIQLGPGKGGIDPQKDSLFAAIGKLGGLEKEDAIRLLGLDPKSKINSGVFGMPVLRAKGAGKDFDKMTDALGEAGYLTPDANGKFDVREFEEKFTEELSGNKQFHLQKDVDVGAAATQQKIEDLEDFKEGVEFEAEQDIKASEAFERAAAEEDPEISAEILDDIREMMKSDAPAGEKLKAIIEKTPLKSVRGGAVKPKGKPPKDKQQEALFGGLKKQVGEVVRAPVGRVIKGEGEEIPEEVMKRIVGLKGRHIDIGGRLSINWSIVPERLKGTIKVVREKFAAEIDAAVPKIREVDTVLEARKRIEADLDGEIFKFMGRDFELNAATRTDVVVGNWIADDAALQLFKLQEATLADVPGASFEFLKMLALNADVQKQRQLMSASTSRAFKANGISPELTGVPFETRDYAMEASKWGEGLAAGVNAKVIAQRMKNTITSPNVAAVFDKQASDAITKGRFSSAFLEYWINSLLSGPQTQAVNISSNALFGAWQVPERMLAAGISKILRTEDGVTARETLSQMHGGIEGIRDGFGLLSHNINRTLNPLKLSDIEVSISQKLESARQNAISSKNFKSLVDEEGNPNTLGIVVDYGGEMVRSPGKLLMSFDEWFKGIGYRMELRAQAMRFAQQQLDDGVDNFAQRVVEQEVQSLGLKGNTAIAHAKKRRAEILSDQGGDEVAKFYQATVDNPPPWITAKAVDASTYQTFTNDLGEVGKKASTLLNSHPAFRLFIPFFRTPVQILNRSLERTPLGLASALRKKGPERDIALARVAVGTMSMVWAFDLAAQGRITGNGPKNPAARAWLKTTGWQPNSKVTFDETGKKVYTSINRLDPFSFFLTMAADMQMMMGYLSDGERHDFASAAVLALRNNVLSKTWWRGLAEATRSLEFNDPSRFVANFAGSLVPNFGATFEREREGHLQDTNTKDPTAGMSSTGTGGPNIEGTSSTTTSLKEFLDISDEELTRPGGTHASLVAFERVLRKMKTRVLWMDNDGAVPDYDIWGEVRVLQGGWGPDGISPFWQSFEKDDPAAHEFINNHVDVGRPGSTIRGVRLTPKERFEFTKLAGNGFKIETELGLLGAHDYLNRLIKTPEYLARTKGRDGGRAHMLRSALLSFRSKAGLRLIAGSDRLKKALSIRLADKNQKLTGEKNQQEEILQSINEQTLDLKVR